ncbi:hypothetical protein AB0N24_20590 [Arthrobacter sp. NPDC093128]|uniref:hypothetical protein n=1 Tax=Arthrobacter sp. NPDC093128 TaxID=3154979 RepID=UPI00342F3C75
MGKLYGERLVVMSGNHHSAAWILESFLNRFLDGSVEFALELSTIGDPNLNVVAG